MPETPNSPERSPKIDLLVRFLPLLVFAFALGIRLIGIGWGLKNELHHQSLHPDEDDVLTYSQNINPAQLKFTPGFYNYGTMYLTELRIASDFVSTYTGSPKANDVEGYWAWASRCHLAGRILTAIAGSLTVMLVFMLGRSLWGLVPGAIGASLLAVSPGHVVHSRFQTVDVTGAFLAFLAVYGAVLLYERRDDTAKTWLKLLVLASVAAGLSAGVKYTGGIAILSVLLGVFLAGKPKHMATAFGIFVLAFLVSTPGVLLQPDQFRQGFGYEMQHSATGHGLVFAGTAPGYIFQIGNLQTATSLFAVVLGIGGIVVALKRRDLAIAIMLAFVVPYYLVIGHSEVKFLRYTLPLLAPMAMFAAYAYYAAQTNSRWRRVVVSAFILAIGGVPLGGLRSTAISTAFMLDEDPRDAAAKYLRTKGEVVVGLPRDPWYWSPTIFPDAPAQRMMPWPKRQEAMVRDSRPKALHITDDAGNPTIFDVRLLAKHPEYIAFSSFEFGPARRLFGSSEYAEVSTVQTFYTELQKTYDLDRSFGTPWFQIEDMQYIQPEVSIWKRKDLK